MGEIFCFVRKDFKILKVLFLEKKRKPYYSQFLVGKISVKKENIYLPYAYPCMFGIQQMAEYFGIYQNSLV